MKYPLCILLCSLFFSCGDNSKSISFRIQNNLGEPIPRCYLGARIFKSGNSYSTKSYKRKWKNIQDGEVTRYQKVKGSFLGYSSCDLEFIGASDRYPHSTRAKAIDEAIALLNLELIPDSIQHPYKDEMIKKERLPYGKYTLVIEGFHPKIAQTIMVRIVKDE